MKWRGLQILAEDWINDFRTEVQTGLFGQIQIVHEFETEDKESEAKLNKNEE